MDGPDHYLLPIAIGPFFLIYIPDKLYVNGNPVVTVTNIAAHEQLFRFGILAELVAGVILILLVLAFYRLFKGVDQYLAVLVVILGGVMPAVIYLVGVANDLGALQVARGDAFILTPVERDPPSEGSRPRRLTGFRFRQATFSAAPASSAAS